jgi:RNA polymerase sigma factor (TIGR02999 family)
MSRSNAERDADFRSDTDRTPKTSGNGDGVDTLLPVVYDELHALAESILQHNRAFDPTRTTSLVNDVYVRMANRGMRFRDRGHFFCLAAKAMRQILIDRARRRLSAKRGGRKLTETLDGQFLLAADENDVLAIDAALTKLASLDERKSRIIELRFFGGLSMEETAEALGLSLATVKRDWTMARAWLFDEIGG